MPFSQHSFRAAAIAGLASALALAPTLLPAQDLDRTISARQAQMQVQVSNLGILIATARGQMEYDAETIQAAADNLVALSMLDQRFYWPEGSSLMDADNTRAMPEIWDDYDAFIAKWNAFGEAAEGFQAVASDGPEALGPGLQSVGDTCNACHELYQQPQ